MGDGRADRAESWDWGELAAQESVVVPASASAVTPFMTRVSVRSMELLAMAELVSALYLSVRTLLRRLRRDGTTFAALCIGILESAADQFLSCRHLPIGHMAERRGYAEPTSVIHVFKRRKDCTPNASRLESPIDAAP